MSVDHHKCRSTRVCYSPILSCIFMCLFGFVAVEKLVLIPVHSKPQDAKIELDALGDVVEDVRARWRNDVGWK